MKSIFLLIIYLLITFFSFSQTNTFPSSGSAGIGTLTPADLLTVIGSGSTPGSVKFSVQNNNASGDTRFSLFNSSGKGLSAQVTGGGYAVPDFSGFFTQGGLANMTFMTDGDVPSGGNGFISFATGGYNSSQEKMRITSIGNVGIGTNAPQGLLDINGGGSNAWVYFRANANGASPSGLNNYGLMSAWNPSSGFGETQLLYGTGVGSAPSLDFGRWSGSSKTIDMTLKNGNVGIGTTNPQSALAVNGTVSTKKIVVTQSGWPDYVFDKKFKLPSLYSTEKYIRANQHLPEVPSTKDVEKNGVDLGANQALLLKKIEELTLIAIAQEKRINVLEKKLRNRN